MTSELMANKLALLLNDPKANTFKRVMLYQMLNDGVDRIVGRLNAGYLRVLLLTETDITVEADGSYDLTGLSEEIYDYDKGIQRIKMPNGKSARRISYDQFRIGEDANRHWSLTKPKYYVKGTSVYTLPYSASDPYTVDITYLKRPPAISSSQVCVLDPSLHNVVIGLALEEFVDETKRARRAYAGALNEIEVKNNFHANTDSIEDGEDADDDGLSGPAELFEDGTRMFL